MSDVKLYIDDRLYEGWKEVDVQRSMQSVSGIFTLNISEKWPDSPSSRGIKAGQSCILELKGETVITGYIDEVTRSYDGSSHDVSITGRDKTGDLVDCGNSLNVSQWKNQKLEHIAAILCEPFGIKVVAQLDTGDVFANFTAEQGESIFETIERLCRNRAVLAMSMGDGSLLITRASNLPPVNKIMLGDSNIKSAQAIVSHRERFADYIVKGQNNGSDLSFGTKVSEPVGTAKDPAISRHRPLVVLSENKGDNEQLNNRAKWEATIRNGRSQSVEYVVSGWQHGAGLLWQPNNLVHVNDKWLGINSEMLIVSVNWKLSKDGTSTVLELMPPQAFELIELPEDEQTSMWGDDDA